MTKTIKLSLAAALLATSVSAVEFSTSGKMEVEFDQTEKKAASAASSTNTNSWDLDVDATVKAKFNDNFTGVVTVQADALNDTSDALSGDAATGDENVNVVKQYVQYTNGGTTALIGKQDIGTPFFDDERGTGVVALQNLGAVTVAVANFDGNKNTTVIGANDLNAQAVIGSAAGINYSLWLAQVSNIADAQTLELSTKVGGIALSARTSDVDYNNSSNDADLTEVALSTEVNGITLGLAYGKTGNKNGTSTHGVDLTADNDAKTNFGLDIIDIDDVNDAKATVISASTKIAGATVTLAHLDGEAGTVNFDETKVSFSYPLAAGAKLTGKYSTAEGFESATSSARATATTGYEIDVASVAVEFKF